MKSLRTVLAVLLIWVIPAAAIANYAYRDGNGTLQTIFSFICLGSNICPAQVLIDSTGLEKGTQTNPVKIDPTGATPQPVTGTFWPATQPVSGTFWQATQPVSGNVGVTGTVTPSQNSLSLPINISTPTTTQIIPASGSLAIYITSWDVVAAGAGTFQWFYGTGSNCGTGTQPLTGPYPLTAQAGIAKGDGGFTILKVPAGNAACATTTGSIQQSGSVAYQQF